MKRNSCKILLSLAIFLTLGCSESMAEMPRFFGSSTKKTPETGKTPAAPTPVAPALPAGGVAVVASGAAAIASPASEINIPRYDPLMDNHLRAPAVDQIKGLFGLNIKQVEEHLKSQGARNHSYAFGKYSRLTMSAYLVTIYFDRDKRVGGFLVEPRKPYTTIEPAAREYFMDAFLRGADLSDFAITMAGDRLEVQYKP